MASESHDLGVGAVRRADNASFDLTMLRTALRTAGVEYRPPALPARSTPSVYSSRSPRSTGSKKEPNGDDGGDDVRA